MSSSSAEEYECPFGGVMYCPKCPKVPGMANNPYYTTAPLIYYARTSPKCRKEKKKNPNCFVKAFRWYTDDRVSTRDCVPKRDMSGFANWLENKYDEYVQDSRQNTCDECSTARPSTDTVNRLQRSTVSEPTGKKRPKRFRSPWKKQKVNCAHKDSGDSNDRTTGENFKYLMSPKDIHQSVSDCCTLNMGPCCNRSNTSIRSSLTHVVAKSSSKCKNSYVFKQDTNVCDPTCLANVLAECEKQQRAQAGQEHQDRKSRTPDADCECEPSKTSEPKNKEIIEADCKCDSPSIIVRVSPKPKKHREMQECTICDSPKTPQNAVLECIEPECPCGTPVPSPPLEKNKREKKPNKPKSKDVECQCPETPTVVRESPTQYELDETCMCVAQSKSYTGLRKKVHDSLTMYDSKMTPKRVSIYDEDTRIDVSTQSSQTMMPKHNKEIQCHCYPGIPPLSLPKVASPAVVCNCSDETNNKPPAPPQPALCGCTEDKPNRFVLKSPSTLCSCADIKYTLNKRHTPTQIIIPGTVSPHCSLVLTPSRSPRSSRLVKTFGNNCVQTTDYPKICIDPTKHRYPLIMRVICAEQ